MTWEEYHELVWKIEGLPQHKQHSIKVFKVSSFDEPMPQLDRWQVTIMFDNGDRITTKDYGIACTFINQQLGK